MARSLSQAYEQSNIPDRLMGEKLKDALVQRRIKIWVTGVNVEDTEYGAQWKVSIDLHNALDNAADVLYFGMHPDRDAKMGAIGDATPENPYGPLMLTRRGSKGWQEFIDYDDEMPF